jgi:hypothetical protein
MAESLYYFLPSEPEKGGRYAGNAILLLCAAGMTGLVFVFAGRQLIAQLLRNPSLSDPALLWVATWR